MSGDDKKKIDCVHLGVVLPAEAFDMAYNGSNSVCESCKECIKHRMSQKQYQHSSDYAKDREIDIGRVRIQEAAKEMIG